MFTMMGGNLPGWNQDGTVNCLHKPNSCTELEVVNFAKDHATGLSIASQEIRRAVLVS